MSSLWSVSKNVATYLQILENLISVATLIRAYLVEKNRLINSRSYTFIRDCRVIGVDFPFLKFHVFDPFFDGCKIVNFRSIEKYSMLEHDKSQKWPRKMACLLSKVYLSLTTIYFVTTSLCKKSFRFVCYYITFRFM